MAAVVSLTELRLMGALRAVLMGYIAPGTEVVRGEINRVSEPIGPDFVEMTPIGRERIGTATVTWRDTSSVHATDALQPMQVTVQCDIHGPNSADNADIIAALFNSRASCEAFAAIGADILPLFTSEPRQTPFITAAQQYEFRWSIDVVLQGNQVVTTPQDFFDRVNIGLINTDARFPPA